VVRIFNLCGLFFVATGTILWRHQRGDECSFVLKSVNVTALCTVAIEARHVVLGVLGAVPLPIEAGMFFFVTGHTFTSRGVRSFCSEAKQR
jgi:hypothetical protein